MYLFFHSFSHKNLDTHVLTETLRIFIIILKPIIFYPFLPGTNSCSSNNGCLHLCLPYPRGHTCKCGQGFYSVGVTGCARLPDCPAEEKSCSDGSKCISSSKTCDRHVDCADQSDEQGCEFSAQEKHSFQELFFFCVFKYFILLRSSIHGLRLFKMVSCKYFAAVYNAAHNICFFWLTNFLISVSAMQPEFLSNTCKYCYSICI